MTVISINTCNLCINNIGPTPITTGLPPISTTPTIRSPQSTDSRPSSKLYILLVLLIISVSFISSTK